MWIEKKSNEILRIENDKKKIMCKIRKRQVEFPVHLMRKRKLEQLVTREKIDGKRSRGWQIIKILDGLVTWVGRNTAELLKDTCDCVKRRVMITYACNRHST